MSDIDAIGSTVDPKPPPVAAKPKASGLILEKYTLITKTPDVNVKHDPSPTNHLISKL